MHHICTHGLPLFSTWRWGMVHSVEIKWHPGCSVHTTVYIPASRACVCVCLCAYVCEREGDEERFCHTLLNFKPRHEGSFQWTSFIRLVSVVCYPAGHFTSCHTSHTRVYAASIFISVYMIIGCFFSTWETIQYASKATLFVSADLILLFV